MEVSLPEEHTASQRGNTLKRRRIPQRPSEIVTCIAPVPGLDEVKSMLVDVIRKTREEVGKVIHQNCKLTQSARTGCLCFQLYPHILHIVGTQ